MKLQAVTNTVHNLRPGDVVEIRNGKRTTEHIRITTYPDFNLYHQRWYVSGSRWVKSRNRFSSSVLVHNFIEGDLVSYERANP